VPISRLHLLTGLHPELAQFLPDTAASVRVAQERLAPHGWGVVWIVVVDGPGVVSFDAWPAGTIVARNPVHSGVSTARNRALSLASGGWVYPLDGDDVLDADGLVSLVRDPWMDQVGWISANRAFLDGSPSRHCRASPRRWARHELATAWTVPAYPFAPHAVLAHTELALAAGGWPALITAENIGWVLAMSELSAGASTTHIVTRYRAWAGQTTGNDWFDDELLAAYTVVTKTFNARRKAMAQPEVKFPLPMPDGLAESTAHRATASAIWTPGASQAH
jgi:hypothetical protein